MSRPRHFAVGMSWIVNWMWGRVGLNRYHKPNTNLAAEYICMIWT